MPAVSSARRLSDEAEAGAESPRSPWGGTFELAGVISIVEAVKADELGILLGKLRLRDQLTRLAEPGSRRQGGYCVKPAAL